MAEVWLDQFLDGIPVYLFPAGVIVMYFWKGYVLKPIISKSGDKVELFYNKHKKIIDLGAILLLLLVVLLYLLNRTIPLLRDYELLKDGYYEEITGTVVDATEQDVNREYIRDIFVEDTNQENILRIRVYSTLIEEGEYVKVHYLPNTLIGEVIERSGNTDLQE